jgi:hypothetical protein
MLLGVRGRKRLLQEVLRMTNEEVRRGVADVPPLPAGEAANTMQATMRTMRTTKMRSYYYLEQEKSAAISFLKDSHDSALRASSSSSSFDTPPPCPSSTLYFASLPTLRRMRPML